jgi:hypothetical protein
MKADSIYALDFSFSQGYGISLNSYSVAVANKLYPVVSAGNGVAVSKDSKNNYTLSFDYSTSGMAQPLKLTALYPLYRNITSTPPDSTKGEKFTTELYTVGLRNDYMQSIQSLLDGVVAGLENVNHELRHITMDNLSEGAKRRLACPLLNLFDFAAYGKLNQDTGAQSDPVTTQLVNKFGTSPINLDLTIDVLPMAATTQIGPGAGIGLSFEFNLFWYLQSYLQKQLADASFTIQASDINSRYYVSLFDSASTDMVTKNANSGEIGAVDYNTAWVFNPNVISSTYPGMAISFTTGDLDFFRGIVRKGQSNGTAVSLPPGFTDHVMDNDNIKINVTNVSEVTSSSK